MMDGVGVNSLGISNLDIGYSEEGFKDYKSKLQIDLIQGTNEKLEATEGIVNAINSGWQGMARDKFIEQFQQSINDIESDLQKEYEDLLARFSEIENNYLAQDQELMNS